MAFNQDGEGASTAIVPYSLHNPSTDMLRLTERRITIGGRDYVLAQHWAPDGRGGTHLGFGASVYGGSIVLAHFIHSHAAAFSGARVVELGAGLGLAAMAAHEAGAATVVATDGDAGVVAYARENLDANGCGDVRTAQLLWGNDAQGAAVGHADVVVAADIVAAPYAEHFGGLVTTLDHLLPPLQPTPQLSACATETWPGGSPPAAQLRITEPGLAAIEQEAGQAARHGGGPALCSARRGGEGARFVLAYQRRHHSEDEFFSRMAAADWIRRDLPPEEVHPDFRAHFPPITLMIFTRPQDGGAGTH
jgi:predicted nicotinamide N-methyase